MAEATTAMVCPKCGGAMRTYERSGVTVDQCTDCRGVFLDRGELERLMEAEDQHYAAAQQQPYRESSGSEHGGYSKHGEGYGNQGRRKKRGLLGELFD